ncbi:MAG: nuclear transport factor 2 family protein [Candidatus Acidiferrales bacterium]|jgi:ketosteroid isomerase-like protein
MKQVVAVFVGLIFCVSPLQPQKSAAQTAAQASPDAASVELVTLTNTWTDAINAKDHAKLETLMAPEFALYRWNGEVLSHRAQWLDNLDRIKINEYTVRDVSAKPYGEFAIVTSVCTWAGTWTGVSENSSFDYKSIMVDTWRRANGKWQVVARSSCSPTHASADTPSPCNR